MSRQAVYLIEQVGSAYVKVGRSNDPDRRLSDLQSGNPNTLRFAAVIWCQEKTASAIEAELHRRFDDRRVEGEWFAVQPNRVLEVLRDRWDVIGIYEHEYADLPPFEGKIADRNQYASLMGIYLMFTFLLGTIITGAMIGGLELETYEAILYLISFGASVAGCTHVAIAWYLYPPINSKRGKARLLSTGFFD